MLTVISSRSRLFAALALTCFCVPLMVAPLIFAPLTFANATTLDDYQHRVTAAAALVEELREAGEDESSPQPETFTTTNLTRVRQMLPAKETVTLNGVNVDVDNSWLHEELSAYEKASAMLKRSESLARIAERLHAIDERIQEIHRRNTVATSDKDAEKGRLAEILRRPEYISKAPEGSALERLLERVVRWIAKLFPRIKPLQPGGSPWISKIAQILVVGICLAAVAFLIWRYGPRFMQGRRKKKKKREARIILGERLEPDQTSADLLAQADALARSGDLRSAIRKAYIALLCELGDRKLISIAQYKTNRDYLYSVRDKGSLYSSMRKLTASFELHWYGLVPAGETDWNDFRNDYQKTLRTGSGSPQS
jgi:Domain of unknown function (DUF4129)